MAKEQKLTDEQVKELDEAADKARATMEASLGSAPTEPEAPAEKDGKLAVGLPVQFLTREEAEAFALASTPYFEKVPGKPREVNAAARKEVQQVVKAAIMGATTKNVLYLRERRHQLALAEAKRLADEAVGRVKALEAAQPSKPAEG